MLNITRVLCPVDLSEASRHALEQATILAGWFGARLTVLHVYTQVFLPASGLATPGYVGDVVLSPDEEARLVAQVEQFAAPARVHGLDVDVIVEPGSPVPRILARAHEVPVDLIVMGTHGATGFERLVLGSVTEKVLRKSSCPVLTVPPRALATSAVPFKHILCAVDFSESSITALGAALSVAQEADADITIVHVVDWPVHDTPPPSITGVPDVAAGAMVFDLEGYRRVLESDAIHRLGALVPGDAREWCTPRTRVLHGKPHVELLREAAEAHADLIVIGVRGRNPLDLMLFGSTANQVVRQATCPVLTVRH